MSTLKSERAFTTVPAPWRGHTRSHTHCTRTRIAHQLQQCVLPRPLYARGGNHGGTCMGWASGWVCRVPDGNRRQLWRDSRKEVVTRRTICVTLVRKGAETLKRQHVSLLGRTECFCSPLCPRSVIPFPPHFFCIIVRLLDHSGQKQRGGFCLAHGSSDAEQ